MISKISWASGKLLRTVLVTLPFLVVSHHSITGANSSVECFIFRNNRRPGGRAHPECKGCFVQPGKGDLPRLYDGRFGQLLVPLRTAR